MGKRIQKSRLNCRTLLKNSRCSSLLVRHYPPVGTFRVLGPQLVAYLDLTGKGNETAAHVTENERLTIIFCAFLGRPQIVRIYCRARVVVRGSEEWPNLIERFTNHPGLRQIIVG